MHAHLTVEDMFATVLLLRSADTRVFLLVEGPSDCAVFDPHVDDKSVITIPCHSKSKVVGTIALVEKTDSPRVAGIVDADFDSFTGEAEYPQLFKTENYDLDADLVFSERLAGRVVAALTDREMVREHISSTRHPTPLAIVQGVAADIGRLRLVSQLSGYDVSTRGLPIESIIDLANDRCDAEQLVSMAFRKSDEPLCTSGDLRSALMAPLPVTVLDRQLCSGHDLARVFGYLGRKRWGSSCGADQWERTVRAAADCATVRELKAIREVSHWASGLGLRIWHPSCEGVDSSIPA